MRNTAGVCVSPCVGAGGSCGGSATCCSNLTCNGSGVCVAPPACKPAGDYCNSRSECCASAPVCGSNATNEFQRCRTQCVPHLGAASSTADCCPGLYRNNLGWCAQ
ncbi:MAG: hypothetical protein IAE78_27590 [Myxococcus sp.]|nr:hypothetical protein [Myxococcus sp.]